MLKQTRRVTMENKESDTTNAKIVAMQFKERHKYALMIVLTLLIASLLVLVAMQLYNSSGTAQLDLSRPGYKSIRKDSLSKEYGDTINFPTTGSFDKSDYEKFLKVYSKRADTIVRTDGFTGDVLTDKATGIMNPDSLSSTTTE